jgi:hypothetical protein
MQAYEKLGMFYLGKRFDLERGGRTPDLVLYDSRDLLTHAMCVGMTGSGKTGLGITIIEEAAIDGVPVLAIDPKGDLANLLLTFPDLSTSDFLPWIDPADAAAHNTTVEARAQAEAERWKAGLAEWDEQPDRIARLRAAADVRVYTPGSRSATPLALLSSLRSPGAGDDEDAAAQIGSTAAALLALAGIDDDGEHGRNQALLGAILGTAPEQGADLAWLVQQIQRPSFDRIGVLDLETFYPAKQRQELALRFNSLLASPGFGVWLEGDPIDPAHLLFTPEGKPRVAIVSIAHLDDRQRMLVVSMLLNAVLDWTRRQSGTSSLRALVYMDEVFGYLPPVANPPSKLPLLTLLKQARAFGVGVMLATQNPVDLDYKALSNIGTWFLGKLQTERDKARVLDGLEGVAGGMDRSAIDRTLSALRGRVFLMHDVHEPAPVIFESRWTLSYLRGPLGREELKRLRQAASPMPAQSAGAASQVPPSDAGRGPRGAAAAVPSRPVVPSGVREVFLRGDGSAPAHYEPRLYATARVHYVDSKRSIDMTSDVIATVQFDDGPVTVNWDDAAGSDESPDALATEPAGAAEYGHPPAEALDPKRYPQWSRDFSQWVVRARPLQLFSVAALKLTSTPGEDERAFRIRVQQRQRESRDASVDKLRAGYAPKVARLTEKVRQAQDAVGREQQQAQQQTLQTAVSVGATILGAFMGRHAVSMSSLGRATTAARGVSRSMKESGDVARAQERLQEAQQQLQDLQNEMEQEIAALGATEASIETTQVAAKKTNVEVRLVALAWSPVKSQSPNPKSQTPTG